MLRSREIGPIFLLVLFSAFCNAQPGRSCDNPLVCAGNLASNLSVVPCFHRPLPVNAPASEVDYACDCLYSPNANVGHACNIRAPAYRDIQSCYGITCRSGSFESINFPMLYLERWTAVYLLYIPGATIIDFEFVGGAFGIEAEKDELYVGKGLTFGNNDFTGMDIMEPDREVRFFDNSTLAANQIVPPRFRFESDSAWFYFLTDKNKEYAGWKIEWNALVDTDAPQIIDCPSDITQNLEKGQGVSTTITWSTEPFGNDVSPPVTIDILTHQNGSIFFVGTTTVTYNISDRYENTATCSFDVIIIEVDNIPPVISNCPETINEEVELGSEDPTVFWIPPTATDAGGTVSLTSVSHNPGTEFPSPLSVLFQSETDVTYIFSDEDNNFAVCSFTVIISAVDTTDPTILDCPENLFAETEVGLNLGAIVTWIEPTAIDISGTETLRSRSFAPSTRFEVGVTTVTYEFVDASGNSAMCSFIVVVQTVDTMPPVISGCPPVVMEEVELGAFGLSVTWTEPTATDLSGNAVIVVNSHIPGSFFLVGTAQVTYTFADLAGNSAECSFDVIVTTVDTTEPTIVGCPQTVFRVIELGTGGTNEVQWTVPTATDLSEPPLVTVFSTANPNDFFTVGETVVIYAFTDVNSNSAECRFTVNITTEDTTSPDIRNCPEDIVRMYEIGTPEPVIFWNVPTATDLSGASITSESHTPGTAFSVGTATVTYIFADAFNNIAVCSFTVTVSTVDTRAPTIMNCPTSMITERVELGVPETGVTWTELTATDASNVAVLSSRSHVPGSFFLVGTTTVNYTFTDSSNNMAVCSFIVLVNTVDTTPPVVVNGPDNIIRQLELGEIGIRVSWEEPTSTDVSNSASIASISHASNSFFLVGSTLVTYVYTDDTGNSVTYTFCVTVIEIDTVRPVCVDNPSDINMIVELGTPGAQVEFTPPTCFDVSVAMVTDSSHTSPANLPLGTTTVSHTCTDSSGNMGTCAFDIVVSSVDTLAPTISNCPELPIFVTVELGVQMGQAFWTVPTATDVSGSVTQDSNPPSPGDSFPQGQTNVIYTFSDPAGNTNACSFVVIVDTVDTTPPTITGCPVVVSETIELGMMQATVTWTQPTATDLSGVALIRDRSHAPGSLFPVGITTVTYIFVDDSENEDVCSFIVNVGTVDTTPPTCVDVPRGVVETVELGTQGSLVNWTPPTCADLSVASVTESTANPGTFFLVGPTEVTYTCTDISGNRGNCMFIVLVNNEDTTDPVCDNVPTNVIVTVELGIQDTPVNWDPPTCNDLSSTIITASHNPGQVFAVGSTEITYTCIDVAGNIGTCPFIVLVTEIDTTLPTCVNVPETPVLQIVELGEFGTTVTWVEPTCDDLSPRVDRQSSSSPGDIFPVGDTIVTYTCIDSSQNVGTCMFTVRVDTDDTISPTIMGCPMPGSVSAIVELGETGSVISWTEPSGTDVSGMVTIINRSHQPGTSFNVGTTTVVYIFSDGSGNTAICMFTVTVDTVDTTAPTISNCPMNVPIVTIELGEVDGPAFWAVPTATDLSGVADLLDGSPSPGSRFLVGQTPVVYRFSDAMNNVATCQFFVTVTTEDTTMPVILNCPESLVEIIELGETGVAVSWIEPTATDISGQAILTSRSHAPFFIFPVNEVTTVSYTFTDPSSNMAVCMFTVTVNTVDTMPPSCENNPTFVTAMVELGSVGGQATWEQITCTDISGVAFVSEATHMPDAFFVVGDTTVTYTCTDNSRNSDTCSFTVLISETDTTDPRCEGVPTNTVQSVELGLFGGTVSWIPPTCNDLSPTTSESSRSPGSFFTIGTTDVTFTCTDNSLNVGQCIFSVTVVEVDTTAPTCENVPNNVFGVAETGVERGGQVSWTPPTCRDLSPTTGSSSQNPGAFFIIGMTTITFTCTDIFNNTGRCTFPVEVREVDTIPPVCTNLPADIVRIVELGLTGDDAVSWTLPTCVDSSGSGRILSGPTPPAPFPVGTGRVEYVCIDDSLLTSTCSFTVTVETRDTVAPTILNCPEDQMVTIELGLTNTPVFWVVPTATDISMVADIVLESHQPGDIFPIGFTTVMYSFQDSSQNSAFCQFRINVVTVDRTPPTISNCPVVTIIETVELGEPSAVVTFQEPTATDVSGVVIVDRTQRPNTLFPVGTTEVTYTFTDGTQNSANCRFQVTVLTVDTTPPVISDCPRDAFNVVELGVQGTIVTWTAPTATDISGTTNLQPGTRRPDTFFVVGSTTVTYVYLDLNGNTASCTFCVFVDPVDTIPPVISDCPGSRTVTVELGEPGIMVTWVEPTATDISETANLQSRSSMPGAFFVIGDTSVIYTFVDPSNNAAMCMFVITVSPLDTRAPTIMNCPDPVMGTVEFGITETTISWMEPTATDISGVAFLASRTARPNDVFQVGTTSVSYTFEDASQNTAECVFVVIITAVDSIDPTCANVPENVVETVELGVMSLAVFWVNPTCEDADIAFITESTHSSPFSFPVGFEQVSFTCRDLTGNENICSFTVIVNTEDTTPPVISNCPDTVNREVELGDPGLTVTWTPPTATDISGTADLQPVTRQPGSFFLVGLAVVTYTFLDPSGNRAVCNFNVNVTEVDTTPPAIRLCPEPSVTAIIELGTSTAAVTFTEPTAFDLASPLTETLSCRSGVNYPVGETTCVAIFTDPSGNSNRCTFLIIVETVDTTPPVIARCPEDITRTLELGTPGTSVVWVEPIATDISGVATLTPVPTPPGSFFSEEKTTVTYAFSDRSGNMASCIFCVLIVYEDTTAPTCENLPENILETVELGDTGIVVFWNEPTCSDVSNTAFITGRLFTSPFFFPLEVTEVSYTCTDISGNAGSCSFSVVVTPEDTIEPAIDCPNAVVVTVEIRSGGSVATWLPATATDISGDVTITSQSSPGDFFLTGDTPVMYTAIDPSGNSAVCTFLVTVIEVDSIPPTVICPEDIIRVIEINTGPLAVNFLPPMVTDNSGVQPDLVSQFGGMSGEPFAVGISMVTFTYADEAGNQEFCSFVINIIEEDTIQPVIAGCPTDIAEETTLEQRTCAAGWTDPEVTDNSGVVNLIDRSHAPFQTFPEGVTIVTYTYGDPANNQARCMFTVTCTPVDRVDPIVTCPASTVEETSLEVSFCTSSWNEPNASDNSGTVTLTSQDAQPFVTPFSVGDTIVTYSYSDPSGNTASCSFTVTCLQVDRVDPNVICPPDQTITIIVGLTATSVFYSAPIATDNSGEVSITSISQPSNSNFRLGTTTVVVNVADSSGNTASCDFDITVVEGNPCDPNPCNNDAFCVIDSLTMFTCVCSACFTGRTCDAPLDACTNNQCENGAACVAADGSCDVYMCECPPCYTGEFCQDFRDACENHQCQNGAECCADTNCLSYSCQCPSCLEGPFCETRINPCEDNQCQNGAQCVPDNQGDCSGYTCTCSGCFTGHLCITPLDVCQPNPCSNSGICIRDPVDCFRYTCQCIGCFTGRDCEVDIPDPCQPNPCNRGSCSRLSSSCSSYTCDCPKGFIGINCEQSQTSNSNPCNSFPCENGATCVESDTSYICMCRNGYAGINCRDSRVAMPLLQLACNSNPCQNGGSCSDSFSSRSNNFVYQPQYSCVCNNGFTGTNCQTIAFGNPALSVCNDNMCSNGGTCFNAYHSFSSEVDYACRCPVGFRGQDCESDVGNPCDSFPCQNGGTCTALNTYFTCNCLATFSGLYCQTPTGFAPGPSVVSCPQNVVVSSAGSSTTATWFEPIAISSSGQAQLIYQSHSPGDTFSAGETPVFYVYTDSSLLFADCAFFVIVTSTDRCSPNPCLNNGRCLQSGSDLCDCLGTGFTGQNCEVSPNRCSSFPCANGGLCLVAGLTLCDCSSTGFTGTFCSVFDRCSPNPCLNNGRCLLSGSDLCDCSGTGFTGQNCEVSLFDRCSSNPCLNNGLCLQSGSDLCDCSGTGFTGQNCEVPPVTSPCPSDMTADTAGTSAIVSWIDPVISQSLLIFQRSHTSGSSFSVGTTTVTYRLFDIISNQQSSCSFNVTVTSSSTVDTTPPSITSCTDDIIFTTFPANTLGRMFPIRWLEPVYDDEGGTVTVQQTHQSGDLFTVGEPQTVTYTFTDTTGNEAFCIFQINLQVSATRKRDVSVEGLFQKQQDEECFCLNGGRSIHIESFGCYCQCPPDYEGVMCDEFVNNRTSHFSEGSTLYTKWEYSFIIGVLLLVICILAATLCYISKRRVTRRVRKYPEDEVAIVN